MMTLSNRCLLRLREAHGLPTREAPAKAQRKLRLNRAGAALTSPTLTLRVTETIQPKLRPPNMTHLIPKLTGTREVLVRAIRVKLLLMALRTTGTELSALALVESFHNPSHPEIQTFEPAILTTHNVVERLQAIHQQRIQCRAEPIRETLT